MSINGVNCGPVFIGGLSHSGKTPLRRMLSAHPSLALTRRTYLWPRFYQRYGDLQNPDNFERCFHAMLQRKAIRQLVADPERIRHEFWEGKPTYARLFALFHEHYAERIGKQRWGDQTGLIERYADPIFAAYPDACMIHMIRDPRERYGKATVDSRRLPGKVGWEAATWRLSSTLALWNQRRYPGRYLVVRYESLAAKPEETMRYICAFLDEPFVPEMLTVDDPVPFGDEPDDGQENGPRITDENCAQRDVQIYVTPRERVLTQSLVGTQMLAYDYQPAPLYLSPLQRLAHYAVDWPANGLSFVAGLIYQRRQLQGRPRQAAEYANPVLTTDHSR